MAVFSNQAGKHDITTFFIDKSNHKAVAIDAQKVVISHTAFAEELMKSSAAELVVLAEYCMFASVRESDKR
nr:hypothetical protein [uncultured Nitrososphaera sp.]